MSNDAGFSRRLMLCAVQCVFLEFLCCNSFQFLIKERCEILVDRWRAAGINGSWPYCETACTLVFMDPSQNRKKPDFKVVNISPESHNLRSFQVAVAHREVITFLPLNTIGIRHLARRNTQYPVRKAVTKDIEFSDSHVAQETILLFAQP